jgi:hypothetical protein
LVGYECDVRTWCWISMVGVLLGSVLGCGSGPGDRGPRAAAVQFTRALSAGDDAGACSLLATETKAQLEQAAGKPCAEAIAEEDLTGADAVEDVATFGTMAQVRFAGDTVFVAQFSGGWKVFAAGCSPVPGKPYDCRLQGG